MTARSALAGALTLMGFACSAPVPQSASPGVDVSIEKPPTSAPPCTEMGCIEGLLVRFVTRAPWNTPGDEIFDHPRSYQVEVEADGRRGTCRITVPCSIAVDEVCTGDLPMRLLKHNLGWYNRKGLEDQRFSVTGVFLPVPPRQIRVRVLREGELVGELSAAPVVRELRPNGAACEPVCRMGEPLELELPMFLAPDQPKAEKRQREREERERKARERKAREEKKATP